MVENGWLFIRSSYHGLCHSICHFASNTAARKRDPALNIGGPGILMLKSTW